MWLAGEPTQPLKKQMEIIHKQVRSVCYFDEKVLQETIFLGTARGGARNSDEK